MSGDCNKPKAPPLIFNPVGVDEDEDNGVAEQLLVLCKYMLKEYLNQEPSKISEAVAPYTGKERDLYDMIIWTINSEPEITYEDEASLQEDG